MSAPGDAQVTRARIVDAAMSLFAERGFDGVSTRDLGERAGCNIATLNYHFGGKHKIYEAAVDEVYRRFRARLEAQLAPLFAEVGVEEGDARAALRALIPQLYDAVWQERQGVRLVLRELLDHGQLPTRLEATHVLGNLDEASTLLAALLGIPALRVRQAVVAASFLVSRYVTHDEDALARSFGVQGARAAHAAASQSLVDAMQAWLAD